MQAIAKFLCAGALMLGLSMCTEDSGKSVDSAKVDRDSSAADDDDAEQAEPRRDASVDASRGAPDAGQGASPGSLEDAAAERDEELDASSDDEPATEPDSGAEASDGASPGASDGTVPTAGEFELSSSVVEDGELLDAQYRCEADSPPLAWTAGPQGTESYAIVFQDDENAFYHWLIYDIAKSELALPMGVPVGAEPAQPSGAKQGPAWNRTRGYGGPCAGERTYTFTAYALDVATLPVAATATAPEIVSALAEHELATSTLTIRSMR